MSQVSFSASMDMDGSGWANEGHTSTQQQQQQQQQQQPVSISMYVDINTLQMDVVYSLLSVLRTCNDRVECARTLLMISRQVEARPLMRHCNCVPMLIQLMHPQQLLARPTQADIEVVED
jgi:hypothetical protein